MATTKNLIKIVEMKADDEHGKTREVFQQPFPAEYFGAFNNINSDPNQEMIVVENENAEIVGTMQLSFIQYLTYRCGLRIQIEAVRVTRNKMGRGIGETMLQWDLVTSQELNMP